MIVLAHLTRERDAGTTTSGWLIRIVQDDRPRDTVAEVIEPAQLVQDGPEADRSRGKLIFIFGFSRLSTNLPNFPIVVTTVVASHYVARQRFSCPCVKTKEQESRRVTFEHSLPAQMMAIDGTLASFV
ncbi:hypothetical protein [Bradyrhizobium sp. CW1]|uniref:hypothetical protein n=1 Tax=unclassified Bradyrhizobium TaxID=2631580 RepID=UPI003208EFD6